MCGHLDRPVFKIMDLATSEMNASAANSSIVDLPRHMERASEFSTSLDP
jgi:hypothetical protein